MAKHVGILTSGGDCPAQTVGMVTPAALTVASGDKGAFVVPITVHSAGFDTVSKRTPSRCTVVVTATTDVPANVEPDTSNNTTQLVIDVVDKTDF